MLYRPSGRPTRSTWFPVPSSKGGLSARRPGSREESLLQGSVLVEQESVVVVAVVVEQRSARVVQRTAKKLEARLRLPSPFPLSLSLPSLSLS